MPKNQFCVHLHRQHSRLVLTCVSHCKGYTLIYFMHLFLKNKNRMKETRKNNNTTDDYGITLKKKEQTRWSKNHLWSNPHSDAPSQFKSKLLIMKSFILVSCYTYEDKQIYLLMCVDITDDTHILFHEKLAAG